MAGPFWMPLFHPDLDLFDACVLIRIVSFHSVKEEVKAVESAPVEEEVQADESAPVKEEVQAVEPVPKEVV